MQLRAGAVVPVHPVGGIATGRLGLPLPSATRAPFGSSVRPRASPGDAAGFSMAPKKLKLATLLAQGGVVDEDPLMASSPPIYQTATFKQPDPVAMGPYDYTRSGNPTRTAVEKQLAALEARSWLKCGADFVERLPGDKLP